MKNNTDNTQSTRRGFFRALFADAGAEVAREKADQKAGADRVSILALKHAKNELNLTKIGIESPTFLSENLYAVKVSGHDESGESLDLEFEVDADSGAIRQLVEEDEDE